MIVTIIDTEVREGQKGDYLYIKYTTERGMESGKAIFPQLRDKWNLCQPGARLNLKLDAQYNVTDINIAEEAPPEAPKPVPPKPTTGEKQSIDDRSKAFALSYAKDLAVAGQIKGTQIIFTAELFYSYLEGNITVAQEILKKLVSEQVKAQLSLKKEGLTE